MKFCSPYKGMPLIQGEIVQIFVQRDESRSWPLISHKTGRLAAFKAFLSISLLI